MADNTKEEHLDNPTDNQSENPPDVITPTVDTETITQNQETENMEVHHHAHDPAVPHHKKNWKSYFWEFLMLFLAVFCGFLAEYQLEHKIERERAEKYMYDMVENLKYDTVRCNRTLAANVLKGKNLDSLRAEIDEATHGKINSNRLYDLWFRTQGYNIVVFNRASITQLKNSGNLRLVKNDSLLEAMIDYYDRKIFACDNSKDGLEEVSKDLNKMSLQFFYYAPFDELLKIEKQFGQSLPDTITEKQRQILHSNSPLTLLNTDPKAFKLLYNQIASKELSLKSYNAFIRWTKEAAESLIIQIKTEYHFTK